MTEWMTTHRAPVVRVKLPKSQSWLNHRTRIGAAAFIASTPGSAIHLVPGALGAAEELGAK